VASSQIKDHRGLLHADSYFSEMVPVLVFEVGLQPACRTSRKLVAGDNHKVCGGKSEESMTKTLRRSH